MSISARFEVAFSRFLAPEGNVEQELPAFARERDAVLRLYRAMVLTRSFDTRAVALQRTGRLGAPIVAHMVNNSFAALGLLLV